MMEGGMKDDEKLEMGVCRGATTCTDSAAFSLLSWVEVIKGWIALESGDFSREASCDCEEEELEDEEGSNFEEANSNS
jgi:hypothetical protein